MNIRVYKEVDFSGAHMPSNYWMELTVKSVTSFAKRRAKGAPLLPAAHPGRQAAKTRRAMANAIMGTLGLTLAALAALVLTIVRGRVSVSSVPRIRLVATAAIVFQIGHFIEETLYQFYVRFPESLGLAPWSQEFFLAFNLSWLVAWILALVGINAFWRISVFALWFLAIASMANGIIHPLFAFVIGGYFPGLWTSPFVGILGVVLFRALLVGGNGSIKGNWANS